MMNLFSLLLFFPTSHGLVAPLFGVSARRGGGRAPNQPDQPPLDLDEYADKSWLTPCKPSEARCTVVQITDVYSLENFPSLKTMLRTIRAAQQSDDKCNRVISMLTGDFLSPYLLSSVDRGQGMMDALINTPVDCLTWGNHEADIDHATVCKHVKRYAENGGTFINTNMQAHEAMEYQKPYDILEVCSPDGTNKRKIGLVGLLSDDPDLYSHFKEPGAFGGAQIDNPYDTLRAYKAMLEIEEGCDTVIPLQHLYVPEDIKTCEVFDVPVILGGHDHHRVDEVISGTRLIKPGLDGIYATVLELTWHDGDHESNKPSVRSTFVKVDDFEPDPDLQKQTERAYDVLLPLRNTELARVPPSFEPLTSCDARGNVCTMGKLVCSLLKQSLNSMRRETQNFVDAVLLMGGNIRGGCDYPEGSFFSMEALEAEIKSDEVVGIVPMPGRILAKAIEETHAGDPIPGWFQYDEGITEEACDPEENEGRPTRITMVAGEEIDPDKMYRVATKISDLTNGQSPTLTRYYTQFPELLPSQGNYINIQGELMAFFARNLWRRLWEATESHLDEVGCCTSEYCNPEGRLNILDRDGDGIVTVEDIHLGLRDFLGLSVSEEEMSLAEYVHSFADTNGDGEVNIGDFQYFCKEDLPDVMAKAKWQNVFPEPLDLDEVLEALQRDEVLQVA